MATNRCTNNILWDNTGDGAYIHPTDCRTDFCKGLREYWHKSPYRLKRYNTSRPIIFNGLFGTGQGIEIRRDTFPVYKRYSQEELIKDYAREYNIPIAIKYGRRSLFVFATKESAGDYDFLWK